MDGFVSAFHQVDVDDDGIISEYDLNKYCEENNLKKNFTEKWLSLFDHDNDKIIHYEEFCRALGIEAKRKYSTVSVERPDEYIIFKETDMANATKDSIIRKIYNVGKHNYQLNEKTINQLVHEFKIDHGSKWNIIVNPTMKQVKCHYDFDGKLYYNPNSKGRNKLLVWRTDDKKRGLGCCCC